MKSVHPYWQSKSWSPYKKRAECCSIRSMCGPCGNSVDGCRCGVLRERISSSYPLEEPGNRPGLHDILSPCPRSSKGWPPAVLLSIDLKGRLEMLSYGWARVCVLLGCPASLTAWTQPSKCHFQVLCPVVF